MRTQTEHQLGTTRHRSPRLGDPVVPVGALAPRRTTFTAHTMPCDHCHEAVPIGSHAEHLEVYHPGVEHTPQDSMVIQTAQAIASRTGMLSQGWVGLFLKGWG